ncbi:Ribosome maturation factor RimP [Alphaproteobacteria bacterium]
MIFRSQAEKKIYNILHSPLMTLGYEIVRVRILKNGAVKIIQIMIDREVGFVTIEDCERVSKHSLVFLNVDNVVGEENYNLEISSPGINRPLTSMQDFARSCGKNVKITTFRKVQGRNSFTGILQKIEDKHIVISIGLDKKNDTSTAEVIIDVDNISEAKLNINYDDILKKGQKRQLNKKGHAN